MGHIHGCIQTARCGITVLAVEYRALPPHPGYNSVPWRPYTPWTNQGSTRWTNHPRARCHQRDHQATGSIHGRKSPYTSIATLRRSSAGKSARGCPFAGTSTTRLARFTPFARSWMLGLDVGTFHQQGTARTTPPCRILMGRCLLADGILSYRWRRSWPHWRLAQFSGFKERNISAETRSPIRIFRLSRISMEGRRPPPSHGADTLSLFCRTGMDRWMSRSLRRVLESFTT